MEFIKGKFASSTSWGGLRFNQLCPPQAVFPRSSANLCGILRCMVNGLFEFNLLSSAFAEIYFSGGKPSCTATTVDDRVCSNPFLMASAMHDGWEKKCPWERLTRILRLSDQFSMESGFTIQKKLVGKHLHVVLFKAKDFLRFLPEITGENCCARTSYFTSCHLYVSLMLGHWTAMQFLQSFLLFRGITFWAGASKGRSNF